MCFILFFIFTAAFAKGALFDCGRSSYMCAHSFLRIKSEKSYFMLRHPVSESFGWEEKLRVAAHLTGSRSPTSHGPF
jgi:hypothetical protein